jgi:outer membrane protein
MEAMSMCKKLIGTFLVAQLYFVGSVFGGIQGASANFRLGIVDFQKALNNVEQGKNIKAKLKKEFDAKMKDVSKREADLNKLQKDIEALQKKAQSGLLKPEEIQKGQKMEEKFRKEIEEYAKLRKEYGDAMKTKELEATKGILAKLHNISLDLGRTDGYTMILEKNESGLVYAAEATDLTEKLIQAYNKKFKGKIRK